MSRVSREGGALPRDVMCFRAPFIFTKRRPVSAGETHVKTTRKFELAVL